MLPQTATLPFLNNYFVSVLRFGYFALGKAAAALIVAIIVAVVLIVVVAVAAVTILL